MRFSQLALLVLLCGCMGKDKLLVGRWLSEPIKTEWETLIFTFEFRSDGTLVSVVNSIDGGEGLTQHGSYSIKKGSLKSDIIGGGKPVKFWFDGADLFINTATDPPRRFKRQ